MRNLNIVLFALLLSACASKQISVTSTTVADAVKGPLNDLNLANAPVPEVLVTAQKYPYKEPSDTTCPSLSSQVRALDAVLGPDVDMPTTEKNSGFWGLGGTTVNEVVTSGVRQAVEELLPFRDFVRTLSGAERHSAQLAEAVVAGTVRRAFLKGMALARACAK